MKKVLFTATVDSHILHFHLPYLKMFKEKGYEVHVATNTDDTIPFCDVKHKVSFERSPFKRNNLKAIKQMKKILLENDFDIVHTHTPMGSVVTRFAYKDVKNKINTRIIYTAHGFHFYKGAPLLNWLLFYPVEKYLSKYTDTLITINKEDYEFAKKKFKKCRSIEYVPGVGIDEDKFNFTMTKSEKLELRRSLGLKENDFVLIYPAEISKRKRHIWLINSISPLLRENRHIHLLLPGSDSLNGKAHALTKKMELTDQIHFLGYRTDIPKLLRISDLAISSAKQEGLPVNIMEAMYVGLPIVATDCRGNRDLVKDGKNGYLVSLNDSNNLTKKIKEICGNLNLIEKFEKSNLLEAEQYKLTRISEDMANIYANIFKARIAFLRTTALFNDSRASKEINTYLKANYDVFAYGWNRNQDDEQKILKSFPETCNLILYNKKALYGAGFKNAFRMVCFNIWLYHNLKKNIKKFDIIHACDLDTAYVAFKISKKYKKKMIYDIYDYYVDCHNVGIFKKNVKKVDTDIINYADYVLLCTEKRLEQIKESNPKKVEIIHNSPFIINDNLKKYNHRIYKINVGYFGILQDNRLLIEIANEIKKDSNIVFHVGGFGKYERYFNDLSQKNHNIIYYGTLPYDKVLENEKKCNVLFATYNPEIKNHRYSAPNKVYEAMALNIPIVVCYNTGVDEIVKKEKIGNVINYDAQEFIQAVYNIIQNSKCNGKKIFDKKYSWNIMEKKLNNIINELRG